VFTDGECTNNPGPGGWAYSLLYGVHKRTEMGSEFHTTNIRMELTAVIKALEALKSPCVVNMYTDCKFIVDVFSFGTEKYSAAIERDDDLWGKLFELSRYHAIRPVWAGEKVGNKYVDECRTLAYLGTEGTKEISVAREEVKRSESAADQYESS
jgi:ribonuclease HI